MLLDPTVRKTLTEEGMEEACRGLVLAVSGGADSMAMLGWYASRTPSYPLTVAHVHHGLRPESDGEEELVRRQCELFGIPCRVLHTDVRREMLHGETVESAARRLRYAFLRQVALDVGASHLATAHTMDDQAETVLLHLIHGAGLRGLCGILPKRTEEGITLIRPLIRCSRSATEAFCEERELLMRWIPPMRIFLIHATASVMKFCRPCAKSTPTFPLRWGALPPRFRGIKGRHSSVRRPFFPPNPRRCPPTD